MRTSCPCCQGTFFWKFRVYSSRWKTPPAATTVQLSVPAQSTAIIFFLMAFTSFLLEQFLQRLLLFAVNREQFLPQISVETIAIDSGPALGNRRIDQHQFFAVADQQRGCRLLYLALGQFGEFLNGL